MPKYQQMNQVHFFMSQLLSFVHAGSLTYKYAPLFEWLLPQTAVNQYPKLGSVKTHQFYCQYVSWQLVLTIYSHQANTEPY